MSAISRNTEETFKRRKPRNAIYAFQYLLPWSQLHSHPRWIQLRIILSTGYSKILHSEAFPIPDVFGSHSSAVDTIMNFCLSGKSYCVLLL